MCGIAGILRVHPPGLEPPPPDHAIPDAWLDAIDASIAHRGPDGQGRFRDRVITRDGRVVDLALVHRRLSILDHAGGAQPMVLAEPPHADGGKPPARTAIVFNGCLYNHRSLRATLQSLGHAFASDHSDTETLLRGWREWREKLWDMADAMYALALWDSDRAQLTLARDHFGEKPLYTLATPDASLLAFSSAVPGLIALAAQPDAPRELAPSVEPDALRAWIKQGWHSTPPFDTMCEVAPGSSVRFPSPDAALPPPRGERSFHADPPALLDADTLDAALERGVRSRLDADVPLGCFLSGGIDSALVCHYATRHRRDLHAFTVRMPHRDFDESHAAAHTARALGVWHEVLDCDARPAEDLVFLITQLGLPFGDSSLLPALWVSRAARRHVRVALSGDGGDELFLGYHRHHAIGALGLLSALPRGALERGARALTPGPNPRSLRNRAARFLAAGANRGYEELTAIFDPPTDAALGLVMGLADDPRPPAPETPELHDELCRRHDLERYLPFDLLRKADTASMSCPLEVRAPFLAREIRDLVLDAPRATLMPRGRRKGLLREVARRYLPEAIVRRPKMGFAVPIAEWFRTDFGGMKTLLLDTLHSADPFPQSRLGLDLNRAYVRQMLDEHLTARRDHAQRLYMLLVLAIWCRGVSGRGISPK